MAIKIKKTSDVINDGVKCLVYGKGGIGKTMLMATAPKPIIISCESGLLSIREKDVPYIEVNSADELEEAFEYVTGPRGKKFDTICLDSISEMAELKLIEIRKTLKDGRQVYGELAIEMERIIRGFRDIKGKNVVFSAKQKRIVDDDTGLTQYVPSMPGQTLTQGLAFFFDEVFFMTLHEKDDGKKIRVLKTQTSFEHDAKDRSGSLKSMERPNLNLIFNKIKRGS